MKHKKRETSAEFMARLHSDPEWVRQDAERRAKHQALVERIRKEMEPEYEPLLAELIAAGVKVRMNPKIQLTLPPEERPGNTPLPIRLISDLVNARDTYPEAIPILVKHLRIVRHPVMMDMIARALTVKEALGTDAARVILDRLKQTRPSATESGDEYQARWALANALTVVADKSMAEEIKSLIADPRYQDVRERLEKAARRR